MVSSMIYAVGRNYAAHAKELGNEISKDEPVIFFKPPNSVVHSGQKVKLPNFSKNVQYELELAFRFGKNLEISDVSVAIDLTARDKQREAQDKKAPWALAKGFKQSCGLGPWVKAKGLDLQNLELKLLHNGRLAQHGFTKDMVFNVETIAQYLIERFPVEPGDIVLTGTPEGVGTVVAGDKVFAEIVGVSQGEWNYE
jgi:acylpyruvate hydrolase